jgi:hypothetical protein
LENSSLKMAIGEEITSLSATALILLSNFDIPINMAQSAGNKSIILN